MDIENILTLFLAGKRPPVRIRYSPHFAPTTTGAFLFGIFATEFISKLPCLAIIHSFRRIIMDIQNLEGLVYSFSNAISLFPQERNQILFS